MSRLWATALSGMVVLAAAPAVAQEAGESTPAVATCPDYLPDGTRCFKGQGPKGGYYWTAIPSDWNGTLVVHAHGGPRTATPQADDPLEDLERFSMTVRDGYASFFFHPFWLEPQLGTPGMADFRRVMTGISNLGFSWTVPSALP